MAEQIPTQTKTPRADGGMGQRAKRYLIEETQNIVEERGINERMATRIESYRDALDVVRERMDTGRGSRAAGYLEDVASGIDTVTQCVRTGDWTRARTEARRVAQEHPEIVLGSAFLVGAILGRMVRESLADTQDTSSIGGDGSGTETDTGRSLKGV